MHRVGGRRQTCGRLATGGGHMTPASRYRHTQPGILIVVVFLVATSLSIWIGYARLPEPQRWSAWVAAVAFAVLAWLFSSLTVEVDEHDVRWHFGPGLWGHRLARADIVGVAIVRNAWWNGFGIRMRRGFRLYNVSGLDAVELRLKSGDIRRIGTDDAEGLAGALKA